MPKKPKTRNDGSMTESAFWNFIRSSLRQKTQVWKPIRKVKLLSRRPYKGPNSRQRFEYQCKECQRWYPDKLVSVDHITPAGSLNCYNDLPGFVQRLFCEVDNLQVLCSGCHNIKSAKERSLKKTKVYDSGNARGAIKKRVGTRRKD